VWQLPGSQHRCSGVDGFVCCSSAKLVGADMQIRNHHIACCHSPPKPLSLGRNPPSSPVPNDRADGRCSKRQNVKRILAWFLHASELPTPSFYLGPAPSVFRPFSLPNWLRAILFYNPRPVCKYCGALGKMRRKKCLRNIIKRSTCFSILNTNNYLVFKQIGAFKCEQSFTFFK